MKRHTQWLTLKPTAWALRPLLYSKSKKFAKDETHKLSLKYEEDEYYMPVEFKDIKQSTDAVAKYERILAEETKLLQHKQNLSAKRVSESQST